MNRNRAENILPSMTGKLEVHHFSVIDYSWIYKIFKLKVLKVSLKK